MEIKHTFVLTEEELREEIMKAWVSGWLCKKSPDDNGKHTYADDTLIHMKKCGCECGK